MSAKSTLLALLPDFVWQSANEILSMLDQDEVFLDQQHAIVILKEACDKGLAERKLSCGDWHRDRRMTWLYKKVDVSG